MQPYTPPAPHSTVLEDVVEEHLDEASFMLSQCTQAHASACLSFAELETRFEPRLFAHMDALVVHGPAFADGFLAPRLVTEDASAWSVQVAALILFEQARMDAIEAVLETASPRQLTAIVSAGELCMHPAIDAWVAGRLVRERRPQLRAALLRVAAGRGIALPDLTRSLRSRDTAELAAAAAAARWCDPDTLRAQLEALLDRPQDPQVAAELRLSALVLGSRKTFERCLRVAADQPSTDPEALLIAAMFGGPAEHAGLVARVARAQPCEHSLFALGYTGNTRLVPVLLELLASAQPRTRKLAALSLATLTGVSLPSEPTQRDQPTHQPLPDLDADLQQELMPHPLDELPLPTRDAASRLESLPRTAAGRMLLGQAWTPARALCALEQMPLRCRHPLALWLALASRGRARVATRAFSCCQRFQISTASALDADTFNHPFGVA